MFHMEDWISETTFGQRGLINTNRNLVYERAWPEWVYEGAWPVKWSPCLR